MTLAPLALDGRIIVGVSGAEAGDRGFIEARDSATGERHCSDIPFRRPASPAATPGPATAGSMMFVCGLE